MTNKIDKFSKVGVIPVNTRNSVVCIEFAPDGEIIQIVSQNWDNAGAHIYYSGTSDRTTIILTSAKGVGRDTIVNSIKAWGKIL